MEIITPQQLWESYDRQKEPDVTIINQSADGSEKKLYFNGYSLDGSVVRIYARLIMPTGFCDAAKPNQLDRPTQSGISDQLDRSTRSDVSNQLDRFTQSGISDQLDRSTRSDVSNQSFQSTQAIKSDKTQSQATADTALQNQPQKPPVIILLRSALTDIDNVNDNFFTDRGYAVLLVDYFGNHQGKQHFTIYPKTIDAFWQQDPKFISIPPKDPKKSCWYYWTTCVLHSVTFLEKCGLIDIDRIGIVGVDEGSSLVFKSSFCTAIKAGITYYSGDLIGSGEEYLSYKASLDSRAYGKNKFPVLINAATNEMGASLDYLNDLYVTLPNTCFCVFPVALRATSEYQRGNVKIWFDSAFEGVSVLPNKPAISTPALDGLSVACLRPSVNVFGSDGAVYAEVVCDNAKISFYYAEDCLAPVRSWKTGTPQKIGENRFLCKLDIGNPEKAVHVFANLTYEGGFTLSTAIVAKHPLKLGAANTTPQQSRLVYQSENGAEGWLTVGDDIFATPPVMAEGPLGIDGVSGDLLVTFKLGDYRYRGRIGSLLQLMITADTSQEIEIALVEKEGAGEYKCKKKLVGKEWTTITLSSEDFKSTKGLPIVDMIIGIRIKGKGLILNSMLWV